MKRNSSGFTIIEVMIVLAIAGLILLMIIMVLPTLQLNSRNHQKKVAVESVYTAMHEYYNNHGQYPLNADFNCSAVPECVQFESSLNTSGQIPGGLTVEYGNNSLPHSYLYAADGSVTADDYGKIVIFPAHRCQRNIAANPPGSADYPVYSVDVSDNNFRKFAAYAILERGNAFCVDDFN